MRVVIGIDPGAAETGFVLRQGGECHAGFVIEKANEGPIPDVPYLTEIIEALRELQGEGWKLDPDGPLVAIEGVEIPNPHLGITNPGGIMGTTGVYCALLYACTDAVIVPPGGNGSHPQALYPAQLWGPTEKMGAGWRRHIRSAWDVAGEAEKMIRLSAGDR